MATTTNFGWTTPNDTDLVKDGAAAIRTLGSSIDTSFVDLKGGTTGQVLSKATGTDLDFTWATPSTNRIIQVQSVFKADAFTSSAASWTDITGLSVSITPTSSSSTILVMVNVTGSNAASDGQVRLVRNGTAIGISTAGTTYNGFGKINGFNYSSLLMGQNYVDSPATTSATTYKVQLYTVGSTSYINRAPIDTLHGTVSSIVVMEIAA